MSIRGEQVAVDLARERRRLEQRRERVIDTYGEGVIDEKERDRQLALTEGLLASLPNADDLPAGGVPGAAPVVHADLLDRLRQMMQGVDAARVEGTGFVYMVETLEGPHRIKIGFSVRPRSRLGALQNGSPVRLSLRAYWPGTLKLERSFHAALLPHRVHLEWFDGAAAAAIEEAVRGRE